MKFLDNSTNLTPEDCARREKFFITEKELLMQDAEQNDRQLDRPPEGRHWRGLRQNRSP